MKKKKLLVFHQSLAPYRVDLWNSFNELYEMKIYFAFDNVINQKFDQEALKQKLNHKINYVKTGFNLFQRAFRFRLAPIIRQFGPDVVISQEFSQTTLSIYLIKRFFKLNYTIFTICDDSTLIATNTRGIRKLFRDYIAPRLDGLILVNEEVAQWYRNRYQLRGTTIIFPIVHNDAVFRKRLTEALPTANLLMEQNNLTGAKCIFYFGRLATEKGLDRLLLAFSKIHKDFPQAKVVLVGAGDQQQALEALAESLGITQQVLFTGRCEGLQLDAWFNLAPLMVLPSHYEPFGAVVNELLVSGADVLCSTAAGAFQLIKPGVNGDVFEPYDIETLSLQLKTHLLKMKPLAQMRTIKPSKMLTTYQQDLATLQKGLAFNIDNSYATAGVLLQEIETEP